MYSTCLFCHAALGRNESFELFPIGRRIAYDEAKGRLWVICTRCERWNLSPLEERWETIEHAERSYRETKKRVATDNVGLARLCDGTDLIRIGAPLRPEFAAWRYGRNFGRRYRNRLLVGGSVGAVGAGAVVLAATGSGSVLGAAALLASFANSGHVLIGAARRFSKRTTLTANDGMRLKVSGRSFDNMIIGISKEPSTGNDVIKLHFIRTGNERPPTMLQVPNPDGTSWSLADHSEQIVGDAATSALAKVLAVSNRLNGRPKHVGEAVALVENAGSPHALLRALPLAKYRSWLDRTPAQRVDFVALTFFPPAARLALEMSLHEDSERRAMEGELHELERRWKEAEEIASIADSLTLPAATHAKFHALKAESPDFRPPNRPETD